MTCLNETRLQALADGEGSEEARRHARECAACAVRLEARSAVRNGRGNAALRKIGAVQEGVLRRSFLRNGEHLDQTLWSIIDDDWRDSKVAWTPNYIH